MGRHAKHGMETVIVFLAWKLYNHEKMKMLRSAVLSVSFQIFQPPCSVHAN